MGKAIVGLRPSFSAHVRRGEHGAPVRFPPTFPTTQTPQRRLKISRDAILDNLQSSLRDSIILHDVPRTSVLG
jgi:hypothetical protein